MVVLLSVFKDTRRWARLQESYTHLNIQGNALSSQSDNGRYVVVQTSPDECTLIANDRASTYVDKTSNLRSIAISNTGRIIIGFDYSDPAIDLSVVRIFDAESFDSPLYNEIWIRNFGSGVAITPSADMVAIGSPEEKSVYTFALNKDGALVRNSRHMIKHDDRRILGTFGMKVALSETGSSVAVASPSTIVGTVEVGAVYVYVWVDNEWEPINSVLYGVGAIRKLGIGGIAIDDARGQISVQDNSGQKNTFLVRILKFSAFSFSW